MSILSTSMHSLLSILLRPRTILLSLHFGVCVKWKKGGRSDLGYPRVGFLSSETRDPKPAASDLSVADWLEIGISVAWSIEYRYCTIETKNHRNLSNLLPLSFSRSETEIVDHFVTSEELSLRLCVCVWIPP